jgi:hypothetical protein
MATKTQMFQRLDSVLGTRVNFPGAEPPRLVRANSAFAKRQVQGDVVVEIDGTRAVVANGVSHQ